MSLKMSTLLYEGVYNGCQWKHLQSEMELKVAVERNLVVVMSKSPALFRQRPAAGMQGMDHCINDFMAHLMYKEEDEAMDVEKTKQCREEI